MTTLDLKIISIFVIFFLGFLGSVFPEFIKSSDVFHSDLIFLLCKVFSAGIILGTGFVHMFPEADNLIKDAYPNISYPLSGFISGISCIVLMLVEQIINKYFHKSKKSNKHSHGQISFDNNSDSSSSGSENDYRLHTVQGDINHNDTLQNEFIHSRHSFDSHSTGQGHCHTVNVIYQEDPTLKKLITLYILELGVAIHSVIIGVTLGFTDSQNTLSVLLIAMSLHQFFEGIAIGSSIVKAEINDKLKSFIMKMIFSLTTPTGIFIGTILSQTSNQDSTESLMIQGILNSISAGVLIYMALIHLIIEDFNNSEIDQNIKFFMFLSIFCGYGATSIIAIWT